MIYFSLPYSMIVAFSKTAIHTRLTHFEANYVGNHCAMGSELLQRTPLLAYLSDYVLYHHTPWQELR